MALRFRRFMLVWIAVWIVGGVRTVAQTYFLPLGTGVRALAWSPDYTLLAAANPGGQVHVYTAEGDLVSTLRVDESHATSVAWSNDGRYLASGGLGGQFVVWDAATWEPIQTIQAFDRNASVFEVSWNADDSLFAASGFDAFQVWETETWQPQTETRFVTLFGLTWHPLDPELLAIADFRYSGINRFDGISVTGYKGPHDPPPFAGIEALAWSTDGQYVAVAGRDWIFVWQSTDGKGVATIEVKGAYFLTVSFISDDGASLVAISDSGDVYTVDVTAGRAERVATVEGTPLASAWNPVTQTLWIGGVANREDDSPDNVILVSLSADDLGLSLPTPTE